MKILKDMANPHIFIMYVVRLLLRTANVHGKTKGEHMPRKVKPKNYINKRGRYVNVERKTPKEIWFDGYHAGRQDKELMDIADSLRTTEDVVSRQAVIDLYNRFRPSLATRVSEFGEELKNLPPANQKTGYWIWSGETDSYGFNINFKCSRCNSVSRCSHNYCPSCGAKMGKEEENV
jgi:hypothetical protein